MKNLNLEISEDNFSTLHWLMDLFNNKQIPCICEKCTPRLDDIQKQLLPQLQAINESLVSIKH